MKKILSLLIILIFAQAAFSESPPAAKPSMKGPCPFFFKKAARKTLQGVPQPAARRKNKRIQGRAAQRERSAPPQFTRMDEYSGRFRPLSD